MSGSDAVDPAAPGWVVRRTDSGKVSAVGDDPLPHQPGTKLRTIIRGALPVIGFVIIWQLVAQFRIVDPTLLSPPSRVFPALIGLIASGQVFADLFVSLTRAAGGFVLASTIGVVLGLAIGWTAPVRTLVAPIAEVFRQLPPLALLPVFVLLLGLGFRSQIAMVVWAVLWPVLLSTVAGAASVDQRLIKAARCLGAKGVVLFTKIALMGALPSIVTGLRLGASYALLVLVSAEMIGASAGIGYRIMQYGNTFHIPEMYAYIVVLAAVGVGLNAALVWFVGKAFPWMRT